MPGSSGAQRMITDRCGAQVRGRGAGATAENCTPVRSMRVDPAVGLAHVDVLDEQGGEDLHGRRRYRLAIGSLTGGTRAGVGVVRVVMRRLLLVLVALCSAACSEGDELSAPVSTTTTTTTPAVTIEARETCGPDDGGAIEVQVEGADARLLDLELVVEGRAPVLVVPYDTVPGRIAADVAERRHRGPGAGDRRSGRRGGPGHRTAARHLRLTDPSMSHPFRSIEHMFPSDDPMAIIAEQLDRLAAEDVASWSGPAQTQSTVGLLQLHGRLEAECARRAGIWQASGAWQADGARHPAASLARRTGRSPVTCRRVLKVGRLGLDHELTGKALASGDLPMDHAAQLANAIGDREELYPEYEADLVGPASRLDSHRYARLLETWKSIADDRLNRNREGESFERRTFHANDLLDGLGHLEGLTDAEGLAIIRKAIDAHTVLDPEDMPGPKRTPSPDRPRRPHRRTGGIDRRPGRLPVAHHRRHRRPTSC